MNAPVHNFVADAVTIPLIIRGRIIEDDLVLHTTRTGKGQFYAPDVRRHLSELILQDPSDMAELYRLSIDEIIDYLVELGRMMDLDKNPYMRFAMENNANASHQQTPEIVRTRFRGLVNVLKRGTIEEIVEQNIGRKYLDGWVAETMIGDRTVHIRAFGARTVHAVAGNSPVLSLQTVMQNALTRGDAIIKLPSNDPYCAYAVARTMIDLDPNHPLTRHVSVAYWKGGDAEVESAIYDAKNIEKIVAWGGFDSMRSIRNYLVPGVDLVALDPKLSCSIVGADAFADDETMRDVAALAAKDVGYFNQGGCVNARVVYVQTGVDEAGIKAANRFGKMVFEAMQRLPPHLSSPHPNFSTTLREEIGGIRYSDDFRVFGGRDNEGAMIVSQADELVDFSDYLDCRVANIVPVADISAALKHLTIHTQTIGIWPPSLKAEIRDECALRGGQRMMPLGFAVAGNSAGPHDAIEPMRRMVRWIRDDDVTRDVGSLFAD